MPLPAINILRHIAAAECRGHMPAATRAVWLQTLPVAFDVRYATLAAIDTTLSLAGHYADA